MLTIIRLIVQNIHFIVEHGILSIGRTIKYLISLSFFVRRWARKAQNCQFPMWNQAAIFYFIYLFSCSRLGGLSLVFVTVWIGGQNKCVLPKSNLTIHKIILNITFNPWKLSFKPKQRERKCKTAQEAKLLSEKKKKILQIKEYRWSAEFAWPLSAHVQTHGQRRKLWFMAYFLFVVCVAIVVVSQFPYTARLPACEEDSKPKWTELHHTYFLFTSQTSLYTAHTRINLCVPI